MHAPPLRITKITKSKFIKPKLKGLSRVATSEMNDFALNACRISSGLKAKVKVSRTTVMHDMPLQISIACLSLQTLKFIVLLLPTSMLLTSLPLSQELMNVNMRFLCVVHGY